MQAFFFWQTKKSKRGRLTFCLFCLIILIKGLKQRGKRKWRWIHFSKNRLPFIRPEKNYFALRVRGTSMIDAGILEGDLAIIEQSSTALDGQIVVAVLDDAITLKRYYKEASRVRLQPENSTMQPIYCQDVRIVGILSNIVRT